jgi:hypothetical protein
MASEYRYNALYKNPPFKIENSDMLTYRRLVLVSGLMLCGFVVFGRTPTLATTPEGAGIQTQAPQGSSKSAKLFEAPGKSEPNPSWYQKRDSWEATKLASLERIFKEHQRGRGVAGGVQFKTMTSEVMRGGDSARRVSVSVEGLGRRQTHRARRDGRTSL